MFYTVMVCLLMPIGFIAFRGAKYARPNYCTSWPIRVGDRELVLGCNNVSTHFCQYYCSDLDSGATSIRILGLRRTLMGSAMGTKVWLFGETSKDQYCWQVADLKTDDAPVLHKVDMVTHSDMATHSDMVTHSDIDGVMGMIENRLIRVRSDLLELFDLPSGSVVDTIPLPVQNVSSIDSIYNSNLFLLVSNQDPTSKMRDVHLVEVTDGRFRRIANWSDLHHLNQSIGDAHYVTSLLADGATIEVRDVRNGDVVSTYPVPQDPSLPTPLSSLDISSLQKNWLQWRAVPTLHVDVLTGKTLPIPVGSVLIQQDFVNNRLITMRKKTKESLGWDCVLLDKTSGEELSRFDIARENFDSNVALGGAFLDSTNRLVLTTRDHRIFVYDMTLGKLIRSIDPFFWPEWCSRCVILAYAFWCLVWLFVSTKLHQHGWLDFGVCSGLVVAFYANRDYADFGVIVGIFAAWVLAAVAWLLFGKIRWSLRFQPLLLLVGVTSGIMNIMPIDSKEKVFPLFLSGFFVLMLIYFLVLMTARWFRFRLELNGCAEQVLMGASKDKSQSISLRDLFCLTFVFAVLFSIYRLLPVASWNLINMRDRFFLCIIVGWVAGASLFGMWVALSGRSWHLRWGIALVVGIGCVILTMGLLGNGFTTVISYPFFATLFGFYVYRLRGWRLKR